MTKKKIIGIRYHYNDHTNEYVNSVSDLSTTSVFEFNWLSSIIRWFKKKED